MEQLQNEQLQISVLPKGAELCSVLGLKNGIEYMWQGDPAVWGKHSPVLFPIVGTLKKNSYKFKGKEYSLPRHGFARDRQFQLESKDAKELVFLLKSDADSKQNYPFDFEFRIRYQLRKDTLNVTYEVTNTGVEEMYFSVGGHPAFALPLEKDASYEDYYLEFEQRENAPRWPISPEGLIEKNTISVLENSNCLPITKGLFANDALVFKSLKSTEVSLHSKKFEHGWSFDYADFPYLGLWAAKGGDFVCVEPWCGVADAVDHDQQMQSKEGINRIESGQSFSRTWSVRFW